MPSPAKAVQRLRSKGKGRVLAVKWGLNPNSSSLGVDVTFLLLGATALSIATPIVSAMVRLKLASVAAKNGLKSNITTKKTDENSANT